MPIPDKTFERLQPYLIAFVIIGALVLGVRAQSTGDYGGGSTQPSPGIVVAPGANVTIGRTGNVFTVSASGGGGGSGGGDVFTSSNNVFVASKTNTFNGILTTSNLTFRGVLFGNTNAVEGEDYTFLSRPAPGQTSNRALLIANTAGGGGFQFVEGTESAFVTVYGSTGAGTARWYVNGSSAVDALISVGGASIFRASPSTLTLGASSSSALTINASTAAIPNGFNIGSGQMNIPASGAVTNTGGLFTTRLYTQLASNIVSSTSITPNRNSSGVFYVELTNNPTLNVPTNIRSGETLKIWLRANNTTNTVTLASNIIIPTSSTLVSPFTIQTNTVTMLAVGLIGTNYIVEGYLPGYNIGPIQ